MKILFYNLQDQDIFANTVRSYLTGKNRTPGGKYSFIFNEFYDLFDEIYLYTGKNYSSSMKFMNLNKFISKKIELKFWLKINKFKSKKIKFIENLKDLDSDTIIYGSGRSLLNLKDINELKKTKAKKVFYLSHIFYETLKQSKAIKSVNIDLLVSENNLYKNSRFFRKYFNFYKKNVIQLPFVPQKRFQNLKPFSERNNKCVVTGTWRYYLTKEFKTFRFFFGVKTLHPMREAIALNDKLLKGKVVNLMSNAFDKDTYKFIKDKDNFVQKYYKKIYNVFWVKQSYFKYDLVKEYNKYSMAAVPEEIIDLPGIGFIEAMACGCVFFGKDDMMYRDIGLIPGKHYITYKNIEDLKEKISYYQTNLKELKKIQTYSLKFVKEKNSAKIVALNFYDKLKKFIS